MNATERHPLAVVLAEAAGGNFPPADGLVDVLDPDPHGVRAVVAFTGHAYVLAAVAPSDVAARQTDDAGGGFGGALAPGLVSWLAGDSAVGSLDVVLAAAGRGTSARAGPSLVVPGDPRRDHPRVRRAEHHRRGVRVVANDDGVAIVGRGLVERWELSVELFDNARPPSGAGRALIAAGLDLVPDGETCWAQVAAGNARSLRAFLGAGFRPVCSEVLIT